MADSALGAADRSMVIYGAPSLRVKALDLHTKLFLAMIKGAIRKWNSDMPTVDRVRPPRLLGETPMVEMPFGGPDGKLMLPTVDEDWPASDLKRRTFLAVLRNGVLFPVKDYDDPWECAEVARDTFQEVLPLGSFMARPYHYWREMRSDAAMSRIAFAGLGALRMMPYGREEGDPAKLAGAAWQHDLRFLSKYEVRAGFEHYGARAVFDEAQRPVAIFWCEKGEWVFPKDPAWEHAKWAWRCTLLVGTTVADHLVGVHWMIANYVTTAARLHLPPTHHLRLLLKPFTWRTVTINAGACETLCPDRGFVHRASALTYESLTRAFGDSVGMMRFHTVPELVAHKGAAGMGDRFPWATDALKLYEVIRAFVVDYVGRYTTPEALMDDVHIIGFWNHLNTAPATLRFPGRSPEAVVDVIAQFIWCVTGLHEAVGTVHEYVLDPTFMATKIRPNTETADVQSSMQCLLVMALTGLGMPRLMDVGDAAEIFDADHRGRDAFREFHAALEALSAEIDEANARRRADPERPWPCDTFNPRNLETGVSI